MYLSNMDRKRLLEFHQEFTARMFAICQAKNADYAGQGVDADPFANFRRVEFLGIATTEQGFLTRMTDKMSRLASLLAPGAHEAKVKDESIEDTLHDLANYSLLLAAYLHSKRTVAATAEAAVEAEAKPKLQLRVGGKYRTRDGASVYVITRALVGDSGGYAFQAEDGVRFTADGFFWSHPEEYHHDLVEEIVEAGKPFSFLEVGKTYLRRDGKTRTIVEYIPTAEYPYVDEEHSQYLPSGRWLSDLEKRPADLVAETVPSAPKVGGTSLTKEGPASTPEGGGGAAAPADAEERFLKGSAT